MEIYKATLDDIDNLVQLRIDFLKMDHGHLSEADEKAIRIQVKNYFEKHIPLGDCIGMLAKTDDGEIVSAAFLVIKEYPANTFFMTGVASTLLNVITYPQYRRKGIAAQVIKRIIDEAKSAGVSSIDLYATEEGKGLYEKLGFTVPHYTAMRLEL